MYIVTAVPVVSVCYRVDHPFASTSKAWIMPCSSRCRTGTRTWRPGLFSTWWLTVTVPTRARGCRWETRPASGSPCITWTRSTGSSRRDTASSATRGIWTTWCLSTRAGRRLAHCVGGGPRRYSRYPDCSLTRGLHEAFHSTIASVGNCGRGQLCAQVLSLVHDYGQEL